LFFAFSLNRRLFLIVFVFSVLGAFTLGGPRTEPAQKTEEEKQEEKTRN
jgi:hypothetical protein